MGYFNNKPLVKLTLPEYLDHAPNYYGHTVADHIDEWLHRSGVNSEIHVVSEDESEQGIPWWNISEFRAETDFDKTMDILSMLSGIVQAGIDGKLLDVFHPDNPDNAMHDDYARTTTIEQAREDANLREQAFLEYGW